MTQSDDAAGGEEGNCYGNAARLLFSQIIAASADRHLQQQQKLTYADKM